MPANLIRPLLLALTLSTALAVSAAPLIPNGDFTAPLEGTWTVAGGVTPTIVDAKLEGGAVSAKAIHLDLKASPDSNPWDVRLVGPKTAQAIAKGDMLLVRFWARATPKTRITAVYQQSTEPYSKTVREIASMRPDWRQYTFYAPVKNNYGANGSNFEFQMGQATGAVEIAKIDVEDLGPLSEDDTRAQYGSKTIEYFGGEDVDDSWIPAAQARIEKYRKADLKLRVVGKDGKPVPGAEVVLAQTKSSFHWGTAVGPYLVDQSPDGDRYRAEIKRLYNTVVIENDLKWKWMDGRPEIQKRGHQMVDWLRANDIAVRGHNLVWGGPNFLPQRITNMPADQAREAVHQRVTDTVTAFKGQLYVWDVVNEAGLNTQLWDKIGWNEFSNVFRLTKAADPSVLTAYNDYNIANELPDNGTLRRKVEARIQRLIDDGAPLDILGDQAHMFVPLTPIPRVLQIWDDWGQRFKKPLEITEFDAGIADDTVHGKYVRDFLTAAFSDPNVQSFIMWGFWQKDHWRGAEGTMFRTDWSPRPAETAYEDLVLNKWRTNQILTTDKDGVIQTRGFLGDYEVKITAKGQTKTLKLSLAKDGAKQQVGLK